MAISALAKRRVLKLIEFMEKLPRSANKHFDMRYVVGHKGQDGPGKEHDLDLSLLSVSDLHTCGTTACALGWAAAMPYFRRIGHGVFELGESRKTVVLEPELFDLDSVHECDAWDALFGSRNEDKTPKAWAKRARKLLKEWSAA